RDLPTPSALGPIARPRSYSTSTAMSAASENLLASYLERNGQLKHNPNSLFGGMSSGHNSPFAAVRESHDPFGHSLGGVGGGGHGLGGTQYSNSIDAVLNQTLDDLNLDDIHMEAMDKDFGSGREGRDHQHNDLGGGHPGDNSIRNSLLGSTQPVNIPGARLGNANSSLSSPPVGASPLGSSLSSRDAFGLMHRTNSVGQSSLYDFGGGGNGAGNMSPVGGGNGGNGANQSTIVASMMEVQRLREENTLHKATLANYEEKLAQAMNLWKREVEEVTRKEKLAESQRDEALTRLSCIQKELELLKCSESAFQAKRLGDLSSMTATQLIQLQNQTRNELKCIEELGRVDTD
ncbi:unnamed protein product, partial [Medioppia subpectinata]